jgi:hypothetical protein
MKRLKILSGIFKSLSKKRNSLNILKLNVIISSQLLKLLYNSVVHLPSVQVALSLPTTEAIEESQLVF